MSKAAVPQTSAPVQLNQWRVVEIVTRNDMRSRHMWGHDIANNQGRASTAIIAFDRSSMTATTASGRHYVLVGPSGASPLGKAAWEKWCIDHGVVSETDVTGEYLLAHEQMEDTTITFTKLGRVGRRNEGQ